jgi:hypothetical protein
MATPNSTLRASLSMTANFGGFQVATLFFCAS